VTGLASAEEFIAQSYRAAETIDDVTRRVGRDLGGLEAILDFGCGCGRVMRRWSQLNGPALFGSDYNADLVAWCRDNLPFAHFVVNGLAPPLSFADGQFDLVYALSVFTHLTTGLQHEWISELERVIRPGGLLLLTTRGRAWAWKLTPEERALYDAGEVVVRYGDVTGTNLCAAFHPVSFVHERLANGFTVRETFPSRLADGAQDVHVLERTG
jgi:SAM-dependent methyltransferase